MDETALEQAAARLAEARLSARPIPELPEEARPTTLTSAHAVQERLAARLSEGGLGRVAGWKIGCTTRVMQEYLRIPHPCAGAMFAATLHEGEAEFARPGLCRPGVECEIAVRLGRDLDGDRPLDVTAAAAAVDCAFPCIELVDDRWDDFAKVSTHSLVADHFFNAGAVLGPPVALDPRELKGLAGEMRVGGRRVGGGTGADILGDPLAALAWLAQHLRDRGTPLRAGEIVSLGSMVKVAWIEAGEPVEIEIERLGRVRLLVH